MAEFFCNIQRIIRNTGSFSGLTLELKNIINNPKCHTAWNELVLMAHGWYVIENIFGNRRNHKNNKKNTIVSKLSFVFDLIVCCVVLARLLFVLPLCV